jgi:hypothetical protein
MPLNHPRARLHHDASQLASGQRGGAGVQVTVSDGFCGGLQTVETFASGVGQRCRCAERTAAGAVEKAACHPRVAARLTQLGDFLGFAGIAPIVNCRCMVIRWCIGSVHFPEVNRRSAVGPENECAPDFADNVFPGRRRGPDCVVSRQRENVTPARAGFRVLGFHAVADSIGVTFAGRCGSMPNHLAASVGWVNSR